MSRMPPDRAPVEKQRDRFVAFECADGRVIFIRRDAVTVVYDHYSTEIDIPTCVIATATTAMPVPYTAEQAMDILYGAS